MEKNKKNYLTLFKTTFFLSAFTFGGGYVIVPLMKKKFTDELGWLEEKEMLNIVAIAQSSPGPMAVNAAILTGSRLMGVPGILIAILGTVLPPLIILSIVSLFYVSFRDNAIVNAVLRGMMPGVCAVIFDVVLTMGGNIFKNKKPLSIFIMAGAFLAHFIFRINMVYIILFCGTLGFLTSQRGPKARKERCPK